MVTLWSKTSLISQLPLWAVSNFHRRTFSQVNTSAAPSKCDIIRVSRVKLRPCPLIRRWNGSLLKAGTSGQNSFHLPESSRRTYWWGRRLWSETGSGAFQSSPNLHIKNRYIWTCRDWNGPDCGIDQYHNRMSEQIWRKTYLIVPEIRSLNRKNLGGLWGFLSL